MKRIGYDEQHAQKLVPLLRSIVAEVHDRQERIDELEECLEELELQNLQSEEFYELRAALSHERREVLRSRKELSQLGCELDLRDPLRVYIPGTDGELDHGFTWFADEELADSSI